MTMIDLASVGVVSLISDVAARQTRTARLKALFYDVGARRRAATAAGFNTAGRLSFNGKAIDYAWQGRGGKAVASELVGSDDAQREEYKRLVGAALRDDMLGPNLGACFGSKKIGEMVIPTGIVLIVGGTSAGKTPVAHALAAASADEEFGLVPIGEPFFGYSFQKGADVRRIIATAAKHANIVLDSTKDMLGQGGALSSGGISRAAMDELGELSAFGHKVGATFFVPANPASSSPNVIENFLEMVRSSGSSVAVLTDSGWELATRTHEGGLRLTSKFNVKYAKDVAVVNGSEAPSNNPNSAAAHIMSGRVSNVSMSALASAVRRATEPRQSNSKG